MSDFWRDVEPIVLKGRIKVPYSWQAGETASFFLSELRDSMKIWGKRCPQCEKVLVPPRKSCPFCFVDTGQWVEVSTEGTVDTFTTVNRDTPVQPVKAPFSYAVICLDGADTGLVHLLGEVQPERICEGMRVKAVFAETRRGSLLDIVYFRPSVYEGE
jgi:uncharacterized OB-fold protein